ncbi:MAG: 3-mercaptopyruvate sulfurtransferase [Pseudomonadota bacterium]
MPFSTAAECVVETEWLAEHLNAPDVVVVDGSWHLPGSNRSGRAEFGERRIPGAIFFDIDDVRDKDTDLPHMLPSSIQFSSQMKKLGIGNGSRVVVYDTAGLFSAARVWWMLRAMGHSDVRVLNGGFPKWLAEDRPVEDGPANPRSPVHFTPQVNHGLVADIDDMRGYVHKGLKQVLDARPPTRFKGEADEPRPNLRRGHMPGASNVPYSLVLNADGTLKSADEIRSVFDQSEVDARKDIVATCGSGVSAAVLALALAKIGNLEVAIYDGSWAEWGQHNGLPVATE